MYSNSTALEVRLWSETQPTCLSGILKSWQKSWLWSFLSRTSNASRGSPNQVKHIDLFSFRKKRERESDWARTYTSKQFSQYFCTAELVFFVVFFLCRVIKHSQSHWILLLFILPEQISLKVKGQNLHLHSFLSCAFSVISTAVTMQITHSAGLLIGSTDASSRF